jgi:uncharacterized OB-fold protein
MSDAAAKRDRPASSPADDEFVFIDAQWNLRQSFRRDPLQRQFFDGLRSRRLLGARDPASLRVLFPPRGFAEETFSAISELVPVGPGGVIRTITRLPGGGPNKRPPYYVVFVQLDGADSASAGHLRGVDVELANSAELIGKQCHAVFKDEPKGDWADYWYEMD